MTPEDQPPPGPAADDESPPRADPDLLAFEPWEEEEPEPQMIGPAKILDAFMPLVAFTGKKLTIFVNDKYALGELAELPIQSADPLMLLMLVERLCAEQSAAIIVLVTDGNMSHAVSAVKAAWEESFRLYYRDPWFDKSFLQEHMNVAGVRARAEGEGVFSLSYAEYVKVIVAIGFVELGAPE